MSSTVAQKLENLPAALAEAKSVEALTVVVVDVERQVLKQIFDARNAGTDTEEYVAQDYLVGERNTRGLSWKLNLLRAVAAANFCQMIRTGVHGGGTKILGQPSNIETTMSVYNALVGAFEPISLVAYTEYSDSRKGEEGEAVHKVGWINKFLVDAPVELGKAIEERRAQDSANNAKLAKAIEEKGQELSTFRSTIQPPKAEKAPKAPKEPKAPKAPKEPKAGKAPKASKEPTAPSAPTPPEETDIQPETEDATGTDTPSETESAS